MFENTVKSATFPVIWELLSSVRDELIGVRSRLNDQLATAEAQGDRLGALLAAQQLGVLNAWEPALTGIMADLEIEHEKETGHRPPRRRR